MTTEGIIREHMQDAPTDWARGIEREFRVPVVLHLWPREVWLACVVGPSPGEKVYGWVEPTDDEVRQIASYIDYALERLYLPSYIEQVRALPLPLVPGHNTVIFSKREDGWGFRRSSWETGSWPHSYRHLGDAPQHSLSLVEVIDRCVGTADEWTKWKKSHAEFQQGCAA